MAYRNPKIYTKLILELKIEFCNVTVFKVNIIENHISDTSNKQLETVKTNSVISSIKNKNS